MASRLPTANSIPRPRPTEQDLDHLSQQIREAARDRGLSEPLVAHYEQWIFLFLSWCLKVAPFHVHRNRIGDFWSALSRRLVSRSKVCQAMDALGFFFGSLSDTAPLTWAAPTALADPPALSDATVVGLCSPLPEGTLPDGVDARAAVPTRPASHTTETPADRTDAESSRPDSPEDPPSFWDLVKTDDDGSAPDDTATLELPRALADQIETLAQQQGTSPEALARQILRDACAEELNNPERPRPQRRALAHT